MERFGTLQGWGKEHHNDGVGGFKTIPTYDLRTATYTSPYVYFTDKEIFDHNFKPLQALAPDEQAIVNQYDPKGDWAFLYINGQYDQFGSGYSPALIQGMEFDTLYGQLQAGQHTPATDAIRKEADVITKYLCHSTGGQPASACSG